MYLEALEKVFSFIATSVLDLEDRVRVFLQRSVCHHRIQNRSGTRTLGALGGLLRALLFQVQLFKGKLPGLSLPLFSLYPLGVIRVSCA